MTNNDERPWLSNDDLAQRYGVSVQTIRKWRHQRSGPRGVKFGRHVRYSREEVERFEREQIAAQAS